MTPAAYSTMPVSKDLLSGPNPQRKSYASYASFSDPDGNGWVFQEITARLTGHIAPGDTSFTPELTNVVRQASARSLDVERVEDLAPRAQRQHPSATQQSQEKPMFNEIDHDRRRLVGAAAMTFVASQFAFSGAAEAQPSKAKAGKPGPDQAGHEHIIRIAEADRCRRAERGIRRSRSRGWPGRHSPARMALRHLQLCRRRAPARGRRLPCHRSIFARPRHDPLPLGCDIPQRPALGNRRLTSSR